MFGGNMKTIKFLAIAALIWFPVVFGLSIAAEAVGIPDTDTWMWILRIAGAGVAACAAWAIVGAARATAIAQAVLPILGAITNLVYLICSIMGAVAVVMVFVRDSRWLYERVYHPYVSPCIALCFFSLVPIVVLLMVFRKTRAVGGISLYLLSLFFGFTLWFYSLMVAGSHGPGWVIGGLLMAGVGVIFTAIISSAFWRDWTVAGSILLVAAVIVVARMVGLFVAERQFEKDEDAERSAEPNNTVEPTPTR
jgi:hypothetical protein